MRNAIYIILILALIGGGAYTWFYFPNKQNVAATPVTGGGLPSGVSTPLSMPPSSSYSIADTFPKSDKISIGTAQGSVEVKNFYSTLVDTEEGLAIIEDNDENKIAYDRAAGKFYIHLKTADASQDKAESAFLKILGVGQKDACKLDVSVFQLNQAAGRGLSFCPGR